MYHLRDGKVWFSESLVKGADPETIEQFSPEWAADKTSVYALGKRRKEIDRQTFSLLNAIYAVDERAVYYNVGVVKDASPDDFAVLDPGYYVAQPEPLRWSNGGYARSGRNVFWWNIRLRNADATAFASFRNGCGADASYVYREDKRIPNADPKRWVPFCAPYSADGRQVFYATHPVEDFNPAGLAAIPGVPYWVSDRVNLVEGPRRQSRAELIAKMRRQIDSLTVQIGIHEAGQRHVSLRADDDPIRTPIRRSPHAVL